MRTELVTGLTLAAVLVAGLGAAALVEDEGSGRVLDVVGLGADGTSLVRFDTRSTSDGDAEDLTGLAGDTRLVGIDHRVQTRALYGVGDRGGLYTLRASTGAATKVGQLSVRLEGQAFAVDVNPAADALRILSDTGQNLRQPFPPAGPDGRSAAGPSAPTVRDTPLTRPVVPATMPPSSQPALGVTAAAYTNDDLDPSTGTTLYDLDTARDQLVLQSPANSGSTVAAGGVGLDLGPDTGFDVYAELERGRAVRARGYLVSGGRLYEVDLASGDTTSLGRTPRGVTDLALPLAQDGQGGE